MFNKTWIFASKKVTYALQNSTAAISTLLIAHLFSRPCFLLHLIKPCVISRFLKAKSAGQSQEGHFLPRDKYNCEWLQWICILTMEYMYMKISALSYWTWHLHSEGNIACHELSDAASFRSRLPVVEGTIKCLRHFAKMMRPQLEVI